MIKESIVADDQIMCSCAHHSRLSIAFCLGLRMFVDARASKDDMSAGKESLLFQKEVPSGGCGSFLCCGSAIYLLNSIRIVSMVKSRFH